MLVARNFSVSALVPAAVFGPHHPERVKHWCGECVVEGMDMGEGCEGWIGRKFEGKGIGHGKEICCGVCE